MAYSQTRGKAVSIVSFDEKEVKAHLDYNKLEGIIHSNPEIKTLPTIVLSIGGIARSGKSFLLNLFVSYLTYLERYGKDNDWGWSDSRIEGINWAQSNTSVTHGIWIWDRPFIITRSDGTKAALLLLDSQGTDDNRRSDVKVDTLITYISLQISSVQVLNVKNNLSSNVLSNIQLCADYADIGGVMQTEGGGDHLFQSLMFVVRDYQNDNNYGEDPHLYPEIIRGNINGEMRKVVLGIEKAFRNISCFNMPYPGDGIHTATVGNWKVKDVPRDFVRTARMLIRKLSNLEPSNKEMSWCWDSPQELLANFQMLKHHLENDDLPQIANPADALQETILFKAFAKTQKNFALIIEAFAEPDQLLSFATTRELGTAFEMLRRDAYDGFSSSGVARKYFGTSIWSKYEGMLNKLFDSAFIKIQQEYTSAKEIFRLQSEEGKLKSKMKNQNLLFQQQLSGLQQQISQNNEARENAETLFKISDDGFNLEIARLQREANRTRDEQEKAKLRSRMAEYQRDQQRIRFENESQKREQRHQVEMITMKMTELQLSNQRTVDTNIGIINQLSKELESERETKKRKQKELDEERNEDGLLSIFFQTLTGAVTGAVTSGAPGAAVGGAIGLGKSLLNKFFK